MSIIGNALSVGGSSVDLSSTALLRVTTNRNEIGNGIVSRSSYSYKGKGKHLNGSSGNCTYFFTIPQRAFSNSAAFTVTIETQSYTGSGTIIISTVKEYDLSLSLSAK